MDQLNRKQLRWLVPAAGMAFLFQACSTDNNDLSTSLALEETVVESPYQIDDETGVVSLRTDCDGVDTHWAYEGPEGPDLWGGLCSGWACDGRRQSPVNIIPPPTRSLSRSLRFYWKNTGTNIVNNGHTIQYNIDQPTDPNSKSYISLNGQRYNLLQFHFHAKSEHTVRGEHYPAEIHFVHQNPDNGKLAVIGVFVEEGDENPFFENLANTWPDTVGSHADDSVVFHPDELMPADYNNYYKAHFWYYDGSLTTPPCSEIVNWFVWSSNIQASHEQLEAMEHLLQENYRPVQVLNARLVKAQ
ncbi:MAG: Carbonic anhydrase precursor [Bacteroidota bacterium]|jgi:carbonic anhydrase